MFIQYISVAILIVVVFYLRKIQDILIAIRVDLWDAKTDKAEVEYWISKYKKNKDLEHEALLKIVFSELLNPLMKTEDRQSKYTELKNTYEENFTQIGFKFPEYLF